MVSRRRIAVYDLYWETYGGGEQVDGTIAQVLAEDGHDVTLLGPNPPDAGRTLERLGVDLSACDYRRVTDDAEASAASADFDVFVNGTYLSRCENRAALGYYYVHFPQSPPTRLDAVRNRVAIGGVKALSLVPGELPLRLREVQAGFDRRVQRTHHLASYRRFFANSAFTARWTERLWSVPAEVLYPPVRPMAEPGPKSPTILSLGRFFDPAFGHSKKQAELLEAFGSLERAGAAPGWELALVGGCDATNREYALAVRRAALGRPVQVHVNAPGALVARLLRESSVYWHGAGFGEDPDRHPERFEHFGIALVEAMAAGAVPVVYGAAGPAEIVRDGVDGRHWHSVEELVAITAGLVANPAELARLGAAARLRALDFGVDRFRRELTAALEADLAGL